jgi:hypothetical protein
MSRCAAQDLIELFRAFLSHYPSMRFGQAICAVASWENVDPCDASDESIVVAIKENLEERFGEDAYAVSNSSMSEELAAALREVRNLQSEVSLGKLLATLIVKHKWSIYDVENDELLAVLQAEITGGSKAGAHGQPISA